MPSNRASVPIVRLRGLLVRWGSGRGISFRDREYNEPDSVAAFDFQMQEICDSWSELDAAYRGRIVEVIQPGPIHIPHEVTFAEILDRLRAR